MRQSLLMLSLIFALMVGPAAPPAFGGPFDATTLVKPEIAATRIAKCGFKSVQPRFDDELQEVVIEVRNVSSASSEQLRCAATASLDSHYYLIFPAPIYQAYAALYWGMAAERDKAGARAWLDERGLLSRLPTFDPRRSDLAALARELESLCGPKAAGTLLLMRGIATFKEGALGKVENGDLTEGKLDEETLWCLVNAAAATGHPLGFIGNEAYEQLP